MSVHQLFKSGATWQDLKANTVSADSLHAGEGPFLAVGSPLNYQKGEYLKDMGGSKAATVPVTTPCGQVFIGNYGSTNAGENLEIRLQFPTSDYAESLYSITHGPDEEATYPLWNFQVFRRGGNFVDVVIINSSAGVQSSDINFTYALI